MFQSITATTDTIRRDFIKGTCPDGDANCVSCATEFDRWLAAHDAEVYQRGREDAAKAVKDLIRKQLGYGDAEWIDDDDYEFIAAARGEGKQT